MEEVAKTTENTEKPIKDTKTMDVHEKRLKISETVITLKQGLKKLRRGDLDMAIALLVQYDQDLKFASKKVITNQSVIVEPGAKKLAAPVIKKDTPATPVDKIFALVINDSVNKKHTAYPYNGEEMYDYLPAIDRGEIQPIGPVIIEDWMKEKYSNEIAFESMFATTVYGHTEESFEQLIIAGEGVTYKNQQFTVIKIDEKGVYLDRGWWMSRFPVKKVLVKPLKATKVNNFKIDSWAQ